MPTSTPPGEPSLAATTVSPAAENPVPAQPRASRVAIWIFIASTLVCVAVYLGVAVQGPWFSRARTVHWTPSELSVTAGVAQPQPEGLLVRPLDAVHPVRIAVNTSLRASDYPVIAWETAGIGDDIEVAVLWQNEYEPGRVFNQRAEVEAGRVQPTLLAGNPKWIGRINGIALTVRGNVAESILIRGATAKTMSPREVLADRVGEWLKFEPWNGASINTLIGGADTQDLPMSFTFAVVVAVAGLIYFALARWRPRWVGTWRPFIIGAMFLGAWMALDARWLWNFARQVDVTARLYAGKSWRERHLAADDGAVFAFIEKARDEAAAISGTRIRRRRRALFPRSQRVSALSVQCVFRPVAEHDAAAWRRSCGRLHGCLPAPRRAVRRCGKALALGRWTSRPPPSWCWPTPAPRCSESCDGLS